MPLVDEFVAMFGVWEEAGPYLTLMFSEQEMQLIVRMAGRTLSADELAAEIALSVAEAEPLLDSCYRRRLMDRALRDGVPVFTSTDLYRFLNHFARYERWDEIPPAGRQSLDRRFLAEFIARVRPGVEGKLSGRLTGSALPNDAVMLLHEVDAMLDAATDIVVQPCDCRRLAQNCDRPVEVCIWLDDGARDALARGHGRQLTREEAKELVRWADKKGLMHTADSDWHNRGLHAICNCCGCDCYPFRAARELGSEHLWPQRRYVAAYDPAACSVCGLCVQRCHFEAFFHDGTTAEVKGKSKLVVHYDSGRCWGCGLCANACPAAAIVMEPLD